MANQVARGGVSLLGGALSVASADADLWISLRGLREKQRIVGEIQ